LRTEKLNRDEFLKFSVGLMRRLIADTEPTGVAFGLENHGTTTNDPEFLSALLTQVGSKRLGITLDTANFYWFGHSLAKLYDLFEIVAPYAVHTHCKSIRYPAAERNKQRPMGWKYDEYACPVDAGDIDFARLAAILRKVGYGNDLCIEDEFLGKLSPTDATTRLAKQVQFLKRVAAPGT
jgi:sugar phosphate isomerase/epimerase